jgi:hypothetical protein
MLRIDAVTGLGYDDSEAADRREAAKRRKILGEIEQLHGSIDPATIESDKQIAYNAIVEGVADGIVEVAKCHWRRSLWAARDAWKEHPGFEGYARAYDNATLQAVWPDAWDAFRAKYPYVLSLNMALGSSYWEIAKR